MHNNNMNKWKEIMISIEMNVMLLKQKKKILNKKKVKCMNYIKECKKNIKQFVLIKKRKN